MIFTPTVYWGDGSGPDDKKYLEVIARELDKDIYLYWTGNAVVGNITREAAEKYRTVSGHHLFLWDNYPVNDRTATMHLGPVINRDPDLCEVVDGYIANSLCPQNEGNRIPILTAADYTYNPSAYDPLRSIGQAIVHLEDEPGERQLLKELIEIYPGFVIYGKQSTGLNPVREHFNQLMSMPHSRYIVEAVIHHLEDLVARMDKVFPTRYQAEKQTVKNDIEFMKNIISKE
jgi:hyaluronoglucosaminidase